MAEQLVIDAFELPKGVDEDRLTVDVGSWEGPLDLLLTLARSQKVDLREISILALVDQYLAFINDAKALKLELAADYLVMAAWLAYLKSGLLLPKDPEIEPSPEELAMRLQLRLERLNAMRDAGARLMGRDRLGRDVFARPAPEGLRVVRKSLWDANLFELIQAYGHVKVRAEPPLHIVHQRNVLTLEEAIARVSRLVGAAIEWTVSNASCPKATIHNSANPRWPPASSPRWNWPVRARSTYGKNRPLPHYMCGPHDRSPAPA